MNLKEKPIFISKDKNFTLYQNDCNKLLPKFEKQFDLIFADPPYFLSNDGLSIQNGKIVSVNKGNWDKGDDIEKIDKFNLKWLSNAKIALKDTGSILISGTYHNVFSLGRILQKLDFKILNIITWQKQILHQILAAAILRILQSKLFGLEKVINTSIFLIMKF